MVSLGALLVRNVVCGLSLCVSMCLYVRSLVSPSLCRVLTLAGRLWTVEVLLSEACLLACFPLLPPVSASLSHTTLAAYPRSR